MTTPVQSDPNFDGIFNFADLSGAIAAVPELRNSPSLTTAVAQSGAIGPAVTSVAQGLVGTAQQANAAKVAERAHSGGFWSSVAHTISGIRTGVWDKIPGHDAADTAAQMGLKVLAPVGTMAHLANVPMSGVQHNYRFFRDVWDQHGVAAGISELLAASVGGTLAGLGGAFLGGPVGLVAGSVLGSEGAMQLAGRFGPFHDSWNRTNDGTKYRLHGHPVSLGRDIASEIGLSPGGNTTLQAYIESVPILGTWLSGAVTHQDLYSSVSGAIDGGFDVATDPLLGAGKLAQANRARTVLSSGADFERIAADAHALHEGGTFVPTLSAAGTPTFTTPANRAYRMFKDVASSSTGQIIEHYPTLRPLAPQLGAASTVPDVIQVFRNNLATADYLGTRGLPSYSLTRVPLRKLADRLRSITPTDFGDATVSQQAAAAFPSNAVKSLGETIVRGLSNRTQFAIDPETNEILTTGWDVNNPRAAGVLYKMVRSMDSAEVARAVAARFGAETDPALKFEIWQQAHAKAITTALAHYGQTDPKVIERVVAGLSDHTGAAGAGRDSKYAYGPDGNPVDRLPVGTTGSGGSPMWETQAGKLYTLNLNTLNSVAKQLSPSRLTRTFGGMNDDAYNKIIAPIFKPQALLTGGFALRNSGNEMLTRIIGGEGLGILRTAAEKAAAKLGYRFMKTADGVPDEIDHLTAAAAEAHRNPAALIKDPHLMDTTMRALIESDGHVLPPGAAAGHSVSAYGGDDLSQLHDDTMRLVAAAQGRGSGGTYLDPNNWVDYTSADGSKFAHAVSGAMSMVARDPAGPLMAKAFRDALRAGKSIQEAALAGRSAGLSFLRDTERGQFQRQLLKSGNVSGVGHEDIDPLLSWASRRMSAIQGLITGQNGDINTRLLAGLADHGETVAGRTVGLLHPNLHPDVIHEMPTETLPTKVVGMETKPIGDIGTIQAIQNKGFSVLAKVMNRLSREPIYLSHLDEEYKFAKTVPGLTDEEAWQLAKTRAVERMIPEIHNPLDRSQFALAARNFIPFFFAREQSYRRLGQAVIENPVGFRKMQLSAHALKNIGFIHTDPNSGQDYFVYPFSGALAKNVPGVLNHLGIDSAVGIPGGFRGSIQGLYAGGESPDHLAGVGWSPLLSIPVRALASLDPQLQAMEQKAEGPVSASQSTLSMFFPNSVVRNAVTALLPAVQQRSFSNAQMDALQFAIARGDVPPNPTLANGAADPAYSAWMDRFTTHTRIMYGLKALFGIAAPSSPQLRQGSTQLSDLAQSYITKYGLADGTRRLFEDHPNMTSYDVFRTRPTSGLPDTQKAVAWAQQNAQFIKKFGKAATFFAPQSPIADPAAAAARNAEIGLGLRQQRTPDEFVHEVVAQTGWNEYQQSKTARDNAIAAHPGDSVFASQQFANFTSYLKTDLGRRNPIFYQQYLALDANALQQRNLVEQARAIVNSHAFPPGSQASAQIVTSLLSDYDQHINAMAGTGGSNGLSGQAQINAERTNWKNYLTQYAVEHPEAAMIVNRLFKGA